MKTTPIVSIIGRPNVGKSTLFNRLMKKQRALTFDFPGVTRDRHYGLTCFDELSDHDAMDLILVDTGGFYPEKVEETQGDDFSSFFNLMREHAKMSIEESDLVLLVVDVREGPHSFDQGIINLVRSLGKKFFVLANKYDSDKQAGDELEFYQLGIDQSQLITISSSHGRGTEYLREIIQESLVGMDSLGHAHFSQKAVAPEHAIAARVSIIGAPNAGKSTLLNHLLGASRALVSPIAGTTVDPIEGFFNLDFGAEGVILEQQWVSKQQGTSFGEQYQRFMEQQQSVPLFEQEQVEIEPVVDETPAPINLAPNFKTIQIVDTAGIRKNSKVQGQIEQRSVFRALRSITDSDIVIFVVDATKGITHQDRRLLDISIEKGKSVIICLNKMDLVNQQLTSDFARKEWLEDIKFKIPWLKFCDLLPMCAKDGTKLGLLKRTLKYTILTRKGATPTSQINRCLAELIDKKPMMVGSYNKVPFKIKYASMVKNDPPTILICTNRSKQIPDHYRRYLVNGLRKSFHYKNTPLHLVFKTSKELNLKKDKKASTN